MIYSEADLSIDAYHARPHVSHSKLRDFDSLGPRGYYARHIARTDKREDTQAFAFGRAAEDYLRFALDGDRRHLDGYAFKPDGLDGRSKGGKAWLAEHAHLTVLSGADEHALRMIADNALSNAKVRALLEGAIAQPTWDQAGAGRWPGAQSRPDWHSAKASATLDLKTTNSLADILGGSRAVTYGYHSQAAMAADLGAHNGLAVARSALLVAEKAGKHRVVLAWIDEELIGHGRTWLELQRARLAAYYERDAWPLVEHEEVVIKAPAWLGKDAW